MKNSKVVWSEGMFLTPQHFQQAENYLEKFTKSLCFENSFEGVYGFSELEIDHSLLDLGKFGIKKAKGIFKDGTPFNVDHEIVIDIPVGTSREIIYLVVPIYQEGALLVQYGDNSQARFKSYDVDIYDNTTISNETVKIQMADLNISLRLGNDHLDNYLAIPVTEVSEYATGGSVVLNKAFIPECLNVRISSYLQENINYIYDKLQYRINTVSHRLANVGNNKSYQSMIRDFLWMSALGEWAPLWREISQNKNLKLSPKYFYFYCISMLGKMYGLEGRELPELALWNFSNLYELYSKVFALMHECLREVQSDNVTTLQWDTSLFASRHLLRALVRDRSLFLDSRFVLVVTAPNYAGNLIVDFPKACKIAGNSDIANIVINALSGVPLRNLPIAPTELKTKNNAAYFEIDTRSDIWQNIINNDEPIALHIDDRFKEIAVDLHIIK